MVDQVVIGNILSDDTLKEVFGTVFKNRSVLFKELVGSVTGDSGAQAAPDVKGAVDTLVKANLIKERASPITDFNAYSITSDGLTTARMLSISD